MRAVCILTAGVQLRSQECLRYISANGSACFDNVSVAAQYRQLASPNLFLIAQGGQHRGIPERTELHQCSVSARECHNGEMLSKSLHLHRDLSGNCQLYNLAPNSYSHQSSAASLAMRDMFFCYMYCTESFLTRHWFLQSLFCSSFAPTFILGIFFNCKFAELHRFPALLAHIWPCPFIYLLWHTSGFA